MGQQPNTFLAPAVALNPRYKASLVYPELEIYKRLAHSHGEDFELPGWLRGAQRHYHAPCLFCMENHAG